MAIFHIITLFAFSLPRQSLTQPYILIICSVLFRMLSLLFLLFLLLSQFDHIPGTRQTLSLHPYVVRSHVGLYMSPLYALFFLLCSYSYQCLLPIPSYACICAQIWMCSPIVFVFSVCFPVLSADSMHNSYTLTSQHQLIPIRIGSGRLIRFHRLMHDFDGNVLN